MYFVINDFCMIEPIYKWSLEFFIQLYEKGIKDSPQGKDNRYKNIIEAFMKLFYSSICRSLLEKDTLLFSFLMV